MQLSQANDRSVSPYIKIFQKPDSTPKSEFSPSVPNQKPGFDITGGYSTSNEGGGDKGKRAMSIGGSSYQVAEFQRKYKKFMFPKINATLATAGAVGQQIAKESNKELTGSHKNLNMALAI